MTEQDEYFLGYRQDEQERLQRQAQELAGESRDFFDRIGIGAGQHVVELGWARRMPDIPTLVDRRVVSSASSGARTPSASRDGASPTAAGNVESFMATLASPVCRVRRSTA
jgi:hypothetical protein